MHIHYRYAVYFLMNKNKTVIYIGYTNDLERRLIEHYQGAQTPGSKAFTARYNCYYCVAYESWEPARAAIAREYQLKGWRKEKKLNRIIELNPDMHFLNDEILGAGWEEKYKLSRTK